jgi:hypothetical protein
MKNKPFSIRFTSEQRDWVHEYATNRDFSDCDALREIVNDYKRWEGPGNPTMASLRTQIEQQDKAITALTLALYYVERDITACIQAGSSVALKILKNDGGK